MAVSKFRSFLLRLLTLGVLGTSQPSLDALTKEHNQIEKQELTVSDYGQKATLLKSDIKVEEQMLSVQERVRKLEERNETLAKEFLENEAEIAQLIGHKEPWVAPVESLLKTAQTHYTHEDARRVHIEQDIVALKQKEKEEYDMLMSASSAPPEKKPEIAKAIAQEESVIGELERHEQKDELEEQASERSTADEF